MKSKSHIKPLTKTQKALVEANITFAKNIGKKFAGLGKTKGIPCDDLMQEALYGLCIAAQHYDNKKDTGFQTYAYMWCEKYVRLALNNEDYTIEDDAEDYENSFDSLNAARCLIDESEEEAEREAESVLKVQSVLTVLCPKEREIVCLIFGLSYSKSVKTSEPLGFKEVAARMKLTPARVHQIYEQALAKMEFHNPKND